jgi:MPBQ/MSBQ methyltransferase
MKGDGSMDAAETSVKEQLKQRLSAGIAAQIDLIGYVPTDIDRFIGGFSFASEALGAVEDAGAEAAAPDSRPFDSPDRLANRINAYYDDAFYRETSIMGLLLGDNEFRNLGYWDTGITTQLAASERLQDKLMDFIPVKSGRILDVACGMGASTRRLLNHYPAENVWAINISERQIDSTRRNAPGCHAQTMNAVELTFADAFFDNIICIEAAFHFETRRRFLEQSLRVLTPGGRLVLSDVLFTSAARLEQYPILPGPENFLASGEDYRNLLAEVGFREIVVEDATPQIWHAHFQYVINRIHGAFLRGELDLVRLTEILWTYYHLHAVTGPCLLVSAQK